MRINNDDRWYPGGTIGMIVYECLNVHEIGKGPGLVLIGCSLYFTTCFTFLLINIPFVVVTFTQGVFKS